MLALDRVDNICPVMQKGRMPAGWGTAAWGLAVLVGLVSVWIPAAPAAAAPQPVGGRLGFAPFAGTELPNVNGKVEVLVACSRSASNAGCSGTVELSPRGPSTQRLTGSATLARAAITIPANGELGVVLRLSRRAREALTGHVLALTVTLRQRNRTPVSRRMLAARERPFFGHSHPNHVVRHTRGSASYVSYSWEWDIPPRSYAILPEFTCPQDAPFVSSNGRTVEDKDDENRVIRTISKADITIVAKPSTGYAGFRVPNIRTTPDFGGKTLYQMLGWPEGSVFANSIWTSFSESDHIKLTVACASSYVAQVRLGLATTAQVQRIFPWVD